jgi:hypothetical protein
MALFFSRPTLQMPIACMVSLAAATLALGAGPAAFRGRSTVTFRPPFTTVRPTPLPMTPNAPSQRMMMGMASRLPTFIPNARPFFNSASTLRQSGLTSLLNAGLGAGYLGGVGGYLEGGWGGYPISSSSDSTAYPYQSYMSTSGNQDHAGGNVAASSTDAADSSQAYNPAGMGLVLGALGVPNKDGHIEWPLALRFLRPDDEARELRQQIGALIQVLAIEQAGGYLNAGDIHQTRLVLNKLRSLMESERYSMTLGTYKEADRFLGKLESFLKNLERG